MKFIALLLISIVAEADDTNLVHATAHIGASYALDTVFYGINSKWLKANKTDSEVLAAITTLMIGFAYKQAEGANATSTNKAMIENTAGVIASGLTHVTFKF